MKKSILTVFLLSAIILVGAAQKQMNVITYNIRYNNPSDKENAWPNRRADVMKLLKLHKADIFSVQEALYDQIMDLKDGMTGFDYVGVGRDDGNINGEFSAIYYNSNRYTLLENGTFWLSETPQIPSKSWDAALNRICTWARLKDKETRKSFYIFNTHFDHKGVKARKESAILILKKIGEISGRKDPVILTGDFNLTPDEKPLVLIRQKLKDSRQISKSVPQGPVGTFNDFDFNSKLENRIDYIFVNKMVDVKTYTVLTDSRDNRYPSDHLPVLSEIQFK
ncbi:MAG TPA: endonuclease/exonuclease/phosphatase family protein [Prolixibacteraceae bacterium]|jgi:endonuclease/exonuclease/phosphatase family metal-dependent hydrolase